MATQGDQERKLATSFTLVSWDRMKTIFAEALLHSGREREHFLAKECGGDPEMQQEVESLLASYEEAGDFIEVSPVKLPISSLTLPNTAIGARIGAYQIIKELGFGGMGTVYLARRADDEFEKVVALKLIRPDMESEYLVQCFRNERQILAQLEHANIARLIDGGTTKEGLPYFVMEYVEGLPITEYCRQQQLSTPKRLQLFLQVCAAVQYAHDRGIVHCDLKPNNILIKGTGEPKLLDFGIARILSSANASALAEMLFLTPAYASPEELRGEPAICASDIYALGVLLLEMLTGHPHIGETQTSAILPTKLRAIIQRAMEAEVSNRFPSAAHLASQIRAYLSSHHVLAPNRSLAILPFSVLHTDNQALEYLGVAIADSLITKLSTCRRLAVKSTRSVLSNQVGDPVLQGRNIGVDTLLDGSLREINGKIRINVQLTRMVDSVLVWAAHFEETTENLLKLEEDLSNQVIQALLPELSDSEQNHFPRARTENPAAYQAYIKGRWHWSLRTRESMQQAYEDYLEAIQEDPYYAPAHAGIADYFIWLGTYAWLGNAEVTPPAKNFAFALQAARRAVDLDPYLAEAQVSLGYAIFSLDKNYAAAEQFLQRAIELDPRFGTAYQRLGLVYSSMGRHEEAIRCLQQAREVEPMNLIFEAVQAFCLYNARKPRQALKTLEQLPSTSQTHRIVEQVGTRCSLQLGEYETAFHKSKGLIERHGRTAISLMMLGCSQAGMGKRKEAQQTLQEMEDKASGNHEGASPWLLAVVAMAVGKHRTSLRYLEEARKGKDWWDLWTEVEPLLDPLRGYCRFQKLQIRRNSKVEFSL